MGAPKLPFTATAALWEVTAMLPIMLGHEFRKISAAEGAIREILAWPDARLYGVADEVSLWCAAQHLHHSALVLDSIFGVAMKLYLDEDPEILRRGRPNRNGIAVLTFGFIPRGKAQSPPHVVSPPEATRADVETVLNHFSKPMESLVNRAKYLYDLKGRWPHPALGDFTAPQWIRFARIHTQHHLAIARDVRAALEKKERSGA